MGRIRSIATNIVKGRALVALALIVVVLLAMLTIPTWAILLIVLGTEGGSELRRLWEKWLGEDAYSGANKWLLTACNLAYALMLSALFWLRLRYGFALCFQVVVAVWSFDSGALIGGSIAGNLWVTRKIKPSWSPKKSYEGAAVGMAAGIASLWFSPLFLGGIERYILPHLPASVAAGVQTSPVLTLSPEFVALVFVGLVIGHLMDFLESRLKRNANEKDSGTILMAHGGILDRFDSLPATATAVALLLPLVSLF